MPGYELSPAQEKELSDKYFCACCKQLLREAVQTKCGHFYCGTCLCELRESPILTTMLCRVDQTRLRDADVFIDKFMRREVLGLSVRCPREEDGCAWTGEVSCLDGHADRCEHLQIPCVHCNAMVQRGVYAEHLTEKCKHRLEECEWCKSELPVHLMEQHREEKCIVRPTTCDECDGKAVLRGKLEAHRDPALGDCAGAEGPCPFAKIGCAAVASLDKEQRRKHLEEEHVHHAVSLLHLALRLTEEIEGFLGGERREQEQKPVGTRHLDVLQAETIENHDAALQDLQRQMVAGKGDLDTLQNLAFMQSERIIALEKRAATACRGHCDVGETTASTPWDRGYDGRDSNKKILDLENAVANLELLMAEHQRTVQTAARDTSTANRRTESVEERVLKAERRTESIEHSLALRNVTLSDLEEYVRQADCATHDGVLLWKIDRYERRRNDAVTGQQVSFYSPAFYTSVYGYKMCARLYLNGDGIGRGTHLSVFFVVMRGEYDALLRWPFRQKVTFMLLDQDNVEHKIDAFRPDPSSSSFQRPRRETNIASGCPTFCFLAELSEHAYVRDDVMFLKIIVDTTDL